MRTSELKLWVWRALLQAGCVAMAVMATAAAASASGGQVTVTFLQSVTNPCNNSSLTVTGTGKATLVVTAGSNGLGALVSVAYAPVVFTDSQGGTYIETGAAVGAFTTQSTHYTVPTQLDFKGQNGASSFSILTDEFVPVNQNQGPTATGFFAPGVSGKCGF